MPRWKVPPPTVHRRISKRSYVRSRRPVSLEVLAHVPADFFHCGHCECLFGVAGIGKSVHSEIQTSYPQDVLEEAKRLMEWLWTLSERYGECLRIRVVDLHSIEGFFNSLRYGLRRDPAFIVDGEATQTGWEPDALDQLLERRCARRTIRDGVGHGST
jgi:hypothetical protein